MITTKALVATAVVAVAVVAALVLERSAHAPGEVTSEQLLVADLAGEPGKEVNIQLYTFPPGASVPWHIHPDAHEFDYQLEGELMLQNDGAGTRRSLKQRRGRLCGAECRASRAECEPDAAGQDRRRAGEAEGPAAYHRGAALGLLMLPAAWRPACHKA